jgi:hypothetical protein
MNACALYNLRPTLKFGLVVSIKGKKKRRSFARRSKEQKSLKRVSPAMLFFSFDLLAKQNPAANIFFASFLRSSFIDHWLFHAES